MHKIHRINVAHKFNPLHSYILSELGKDSPVENLPAMQENLVKLARHNKRDLFYVEKILKWKKNKVLVKWLGYKVPTWEPKSVLKGLPS